ncbi:MAG: aminodeoxychorismate synthase component I [Sphingomicrobium sp.]
MTRSPATEWHRIAEQPFVLLEFGGSAQLYRSGTVIDVRESAQVGAALDELRGRNAVGFLAYEAGFALERKLAAKDARGELPLLWFMVDARREEAPELPNTDGAWASAPSPLIERADYLAAVETIQQHIIDGDIYQANFTFQSQVRTQGHPLALYAQLRERAQANWGAIMFTGTHWILSLSPELFFTCQGGQVTCRPMKGTAAPESDPETLRNDPKQRAENLMIVDLLRNDLSRVAEPGTVRVPELFEVERYPTVLQMTSTVTGRLQDRTGPINLLKAMFPCGSITGAPKIRAMEIIDELERGHRRVYTGSIGRLSTDGDAAFNVAIRTLVLPTGESVATIGLGSGIVVDSRGDAEWEECRAKGAFVATCAKFNLIETMRAENGMLADLHAHLDRLGSSAETFGFPFDRPALETALAERSGASGRIRLELAPDGSWTIDLSPMPQSPEVAQVAIVPRPTDRFDFRLAHKMTDRAFYDSAREESGAFEIVFVDDAGFLTEGSFTNLFVERDGRLITPPLSRGLLPGILRQKLLLNGDAVEGDLREEDLEAGFYVGNALRGLIRARLRP